MDEDRRHDRCPRVSFQLPTSPRPTRHSSPERRVRYLSNENDRLQEELAYYKGRIRRLQQDLNYLQHFYEATQRFHDTLRRSQIRLHDSLVGFQRKDYKEREG